MPDSPKQKKPIISFGDIVGGLSSETTPADKESEEEFLSFDEFLPDVKPLSDEELQNPLLEEPPRPSTANALGQIDHNTDVVEQEIPPKVLEEESFPELPDHVQPLASLGESNARNVQAARAQQAPKATQPPQASLPPREEFFLALASENVEIAKLIAAREHATPSEAFADIGPDDFIIHKEVMTPDIIDFTSISDQITNRERTVAPSQPRGQSSEELRMNHFAEPVQRTCRKLEELLTECFAKVDTGEFSYEECEALCRSTVAKVQSIEALIEKYPGEKNAVIEVIFEDYPYNIIRHCVNVFFIAIEMGLTLHFPPEKLVHLGVVSLLHDLIMYKMPEKLLNNPGSFSDEERAIWKKSLEKGSKALEALVMPKWVYNIICYNVRNHLQNKLELEDQEQFEFAKIIELANSYEAITHKRPWRGSLEGFTVVSIMLKSTDTTPQYVIKALFMTFSIFPPNSYVRLNNGEYALVVGVNKHAPLRPVVKILYDNHKMPKKEVKTVNLNEFKTFTVADPVPTAEIEKAS